MNDTYDTVSIFIVVNAWSSNTLSSNGPCYWYVVHTTFPRRWWRGIVARSHVTAIRASKEAQAREVVRQLSATIALQSWFRGCLDRTLRRQQAAAVVAIQARWRGASERKLSAERTTAAVRLQAFVRAASKAARYRRSRAAATALQARWRGVVTRVWLTAETEVKAAEAAAALAAEVQAVREEGAAVMLQALARGRSRRVVFGRVIGATVVVQGAWRGRMARRRTEVLRARSRAAVVIQAWWRMASAKAERSCIR